MLESEPIFSASDQKMFATHQKFMRQALALAQHAYLEDEVPVGAIVVHNDQVVGRGFNQVEKFVDPTAHAEIIAVTAACDTLKRKHLHGCTLYVTLEPCAMCTGALVLARIDTIVFGATDPKTGCCGSLYNLSTDDRLNHRIQVLGGVLEEECEAYLKKFFRNRRNGDTSR